MPGYFIEMLIDDEAVEVGEAQSDAVMLEIGKPVLPRTDYVVQESGSPLPTDPAIVVVYEV